MSNLPRHPDHEYLNLVQDVLKHGVGKDDRTGTGTKSVFSREMRFDLSDGSIPLLTTKKMHVRSIIHEILWYLQGSGSGQYLKDNNVRIWNEWMDRDNHLNYVYGYQWRRWPTLTEETTPTLIPLKNNIGRDEDYTTPFEKVSPIHDDLADYLVGQYFTNIRGQAFRVIQRTSVDQPSLYNIQFEQTNTIINVQCDDITDKTAFDPYAKTVGLEKGCIGIINTKAVHYADAYRLWTDMMKRCHYPSSREFALYGKNGIFVDSAWRCFENFLRDVRYLPGFHRWCESPSSYCLDIKYYDSDCYSAETCVFISAKYSRQLETLDGSKIVATNEHAVVEHTVIRDMENELEVTRKEIYASMNKDEEHTASEWTFEQVNPPAGFVYRKTIFVDQISNVLEQLKNNPTSRRIIVNAWNVSQLNDMNLPPCHFSFQFWVNHETNQLSCKMTKRSCEVGLGVPFNIVQYSIITRMFAHVAGLQPGEFIWSGGDVHIYNNHIDALREQVERVPYPSPTLTLNPDIESIDDFKYNDFEIQDYRCHPTIPMEVSI